MNTIELNNGVKIPQIALGVFQIPENEAAKQACLSALALGYRHIDSAHHYYNEAGLGAAVREAIAEGSCTREELFITSKMWVQDMQSYDMAKAAIGASLKKAAWNIWTSTCFIRR